MTLVSVVTYRKILIVKDIADLGYQRTKVFLSTTYSEQRCKSSEGWRVSFWAESYNLSVLVH